jgi:hypothetical protein
VSPPQITAVGPVLNTLSPNTQVTPLVSTEMAEIPFTIL